MMPATIREKYEAAWARLVDLVRQRNRLLKQPGTISNFASDFSPATAMLIEMDFNRARDILTEADAMMPAIYAAIDELNTYAVQLGELVIERKYPLV